MESGVPWEHGRVTRWCPNSKTLITAGDELRTRDIPPETQLVLFSAEKTAPCLDLKAVAE